MKLKLAPFKNGQRLRYMGNRHVTTTVNGKDVLVIANNMEVEIVDTKPPEKGMGVIGQDEDGEDIIDYDCNGYNVYVNYFGQRRIIHVQDKKEWEEIK